MIKTRNLDPTLISWIMSVTGLGPGIGALKYLVPDSSSTSQYRSWLNYLGVKESDMFSDLPAAYAALVGGRNDVLLVAPGDHTLSAQVTWALNQTHMLGLGGPNLRVQPNTLTTGGLRLKTTTANVPYVLRVEGNYCQFHGIGTYNNGADTDNLGDIAIIGKNCYFKRCDFRGGNNVTQNSATTPFAGIPVVFPGGSGYGNGTTFEDCQIGSAGNYVRTYGPGCVLFIGGVGTQAFDVKFKRCTLETWIETLGAGVGFIMLNSASYPADRFIEIDDCLLYNFWTNHVDKINYAVVEPGGSPTTHSFVVRKSTLVGCDFWSNNASFVFADMPDVAAYGGTVEGVSVS